MALLPPNPEIILKPNGVGQINALCFMNQSHLLAATEKKGVFIFDVIAHKSQYQSQDETSSPLLSIHCGSDLLTVMEKGGTIKTHQLTDLNGHPCATSNQNYYGFCKTAYLDKEQLLFAPKDKNTIDIFSTQSLEYNYSLSVPDDMSDIGMITSLKELYISEQLYLLAGYESGKVLLWDLRKLNILSQLDGKEFITSIDYDLNKKCGLLCNSTSAIEIFEIKNMTELIHTKTMSIKNPGLNCVKIRNDNKIFCTGGWDTKIRVFSWKTLRPLAVLTEHKKSVTDIAYTTLNTNRSITMASCSDGQICFWDIY